MTAAPTGFLPLRGPYVPAHGRGEVVKHRPLCLCGGAVERSDAFDAYFCVASRMWLEKQCSDSGCRNCNARPLHAP